MNIENILKYRKNSIFELPKNCVILINGKLKELNNSRKSLVIILKECGTK